ncbi:MAG TPA: hypothetical protein VKY81_03765 [Natronosporangium sp.]|nr:hypothetical protein [Natronosporangium sp.]
MAPLLRNVCVLLALALAACGCGRPVGGDGDPPATDPTPTGSTSAGPTSGGPEVGPAPDPDAPAMARIGCADGRTRVLTPTVAAQPDGVHLRVDNSSSDRTLYLRRGGEIVMVNRAPAGTSEAVATEPPGSWELACVVPTADPEERRGWIRLEVTDPLGLWVPADPDCEQPLRTDINYLVEPEGRPGDPVDLAAEDLAHTFPEWSPADTFEPAGYPQAVPRLVRVVRGGTVIAVAEYLRGSTGGWYLNSFAHC